MILVENSSFGPSTNSSVVAHQQNQFESIESCSVNFPLLELEEFEHLLTPPHSESPVRSDKSSDIEPTPFIDDLNLYTSGFDYSSELSDEDLKCLELDLSDCSSEDRLEDDLESLTPSYPPYLTQRDLCQTSMSNYSSVSSTISSIVDDSSLRLVDTRKASYPSSIKTAHVNLFSSAFDNFSNYGSGSSSSSTPSTPSSTIGSSSAVQHLNGLASNALPGFSEICPSRYNSQLECNIFKFDTYQSESESCSDNELENSIAAPLQLNGCSTADLVLKEEPMDSFMPSLTNTLDTSMQPKDVSPYCDFESSLMIPKNTVGSFGQLTSDKMEEDQKEGEFPLFTAQSPKPMRLHLHNLTINFRTAGSSSSSSQLCTPSTSFIPTTYDAPNPTLTSTSARIGQTASQQQLSEQGSIYTTSTPPYPLQNSALNTLFGQQCTSESNPTVTLESRPTMTTELDNSSYRGKNRISRSKPHQMQICAVCGDVAACQHYGVLTCEGCKGFFKRTVQKNSKYTCLGNRDCTVDKRRRNRCQFCRFQKCLAVGMVKEVVRTDNLKGRRGRLPSKPKSPQEMPITPPMSTIAALVKAHEETSADKANLDFSQYSEFSSNQIDQRYCELHDQQVLTLLSSSLDIVFAFMEKIPGFSELSEMDKQFLFQSSCLELFALRMAYRITSGTSYLVLCNNIVLHRNQFIYTFPEWLPMIEELSSQLHTMKLDVSAFACLCALTVISGRHGVHDPNKIDQLETKIISSLRDHTIYNSEAQKKPNYFSRILSKLSELRTIGEFGHRSIIQKIRQMSMSNLTPEIINLERKISVNVMEPCSTHQQSNLNMPGNSSTPLDLPSISTFFPDPSK